LCDVATERQEANRPRSLNGNRSCSSNDDSCGRSRPGIAVLHSDDRVGGKAAPIAQARRYLASPLKRNFSPNVSKEAFWCDDLGTYALALDGAKQPSKVRTSNAGQLLFTGIARADRARMSAKRCFVSTESFLKRPRLYRS
jgi:hypothetical protein